MCIAVFGDGPITIKMLWESLHPVLPRDSDKQRVSVSQAYDMVIRNNSAKPMKRLTIVHPLGLMPGPRDRLGGNVPTWQPVVSGAGEGGFAWLGRRMFRKDPTVRDGMIVLPVDGPYTDETRDIRAKLVDAVSVRIHPSVGPDERALFELGWPTPMEVELSEELKPYVPDDDTTSYFLRLVFQPETVKPVSIQMVSLPAPNKARLVKRTFHAVSPEIVCEKLEDKLHRARNGQHRASAERLIEQLVMKGFRAEGNTTRICDFRVAVVTDNRCFLFDSHTLGAVGFAEIRDLVDTGTQGQPSGRPTYHAHVWFAGSDSYPQEDPFCIAEGLCRYMCEHRDERRNGYEMTEIVGAVGCDEVANVHVVMETLASIGDVKRPSRRGGHGWLLTDQAVQRVTAGKPDSDWEREVRAEVARRSVESDVPVFRHGAFRILFSIGWFLRSDP